MIHGGLQRIRRELGGVGLASLGLLAGAALFFFLALKPLEARNERLQQRLGESTRMNAAPGAGPASASQTAAKLDALYQFLETKEHKSDLLAKLHAIGAAAGVEVRAADYKLHKSGVRIERYEITLPVTGSYAQIRAFLGNALAGIPALSLDQVSFRKQRPNDAQVQAEMRLTLHLVRPQ
jgi:Tfp pilus assembly protein PilO